MFTFAVQNYNFKPKLCTLPMVILNYVAANKTPKLRKAVFYFNIAYIFITLFFIWTMRL
jgi:hypothetical protein